VRKLNETLRSSPEGSTSVLIDLDHHSEMTAAIFTEGHTVQQPIRAHN